MDKELTKKLEKAIELHNQSRDILNNLLDKKLKEHSQNYWIRKGILTSQITRLAHQRDRMHTETIIKSLQKMT
jgi:cobalamin biosynthesis Co2+ chelatase CbiK